MNATLLSAFTVMAVGVALAPTPPARRPGALVADAHVGPRRRSRLRHPSAIRRPPSDPAELAAWCDALARAVRGGATVRHAVATVPPPRSVAAAIEPVHHALDRGAALADALGEAAVGGRTPPHLDLVLVVLRACAQHGGAAGEPIDRCAAALRQRAALLGERASNSAQARLSALVMTLLPVVLLGVLVLTSAPVRHAVATPLGAAVVAAGGVLNTLGWVWMRRLIRGGARWR